MALKKKNTGVHLETKDVFAKANKGIYFKSNQWKFFSVETAQTYILVWD